jgi:hypothetical protein
MTFRVDHKYTIPSTFYRKILEIKTLQFAVSQIPIRILSAELRNFCDDNSWSNVVLKYVLLYLLSDY